MFLRPLAPLPLWLSFAGPAGSGAGGKRRCGVCRTVPSCTLVITKGGATLCHLRDMMSLPCRPPYTIMAASVLAMGCTDGGVGLGHSDQAACGSTPELDGTEVQGTATDHETGARWHACRDCDRTR